MTGGLSVLTALALQKGVFSLELYAQIFVSMALTASGGFAINDYFDRKSDAGKSGQAGICERPEIAADDVGSGSQNRAWSRRKPEENARAREVIDRVK